MREISRRRFLTAASTLPLAALLPRGILLDAIARAGPLLFFTDHQAAVVREATARLIPGPDDDPLEAGHPGAREANVVRYIDTMLGAFELDPPHIHAGGPFSDRAGSAVNHMSDFLPLPPAKEKAWRDRIAGLQKTYRDGVALLDEQAGGDFAAADPLTQDQVLASSEAGEFRDVLFTGAIEGMYSVPEYGGNAGLVGWTEIRFPGDSQPRGYTPAQVSEGDGPDPVDPAGLLPMVTARFGDAVGILVRIKRHGL